MDGFWFRIHTRLKNERRIKNEVKVVSLHVEETSTFHGSGRTAFIMHSTYLPFT